MKHPFRSAVAAVSSMVMLTSLAACGGSDTAQSDEKERPFAVWCGWVCQVVTVLRSSLPQVR